LRFLTSNNIVTLKSWLEVTECHWNWCHSKAWERFPIHLLCDIQCQKMAWPWKPG